MCVQDFNLYQGAQMIAQNRSISGATQTLIMGPNKARIGFIVGYPGTSGEIFMGGSGAGFLMTQISTSQNRLNTNFLLTEWGKIIQEEIYVELGATRTLYWWEYLLPLDREERERIAQGFNNK